MERSAYFGKRNKCDIEGCPDARVEVVAWNDAIASQLEPEHPGPQYPSGIRGSRDPITMPISNVGLCQRHAEEYRASKGPDQA